MASDVPVQLGDQNGAERAHNGERGPTTSDERKQKKHKKDSKERSKDSKHRKKSKSGRKSSRDHSRRDGSRPTSPRGACCSDYVAIRCAAESGECRSRTTDTILECAVLPVMYLAAGHAAMPGN
jgi:hypothetical protein